MRTTDIINGEFRLKIERFLPTKTYGYCINSETPMQQVTKCDCYKRRIELLYDFDVERVEVCRGWWNYMLVEIGLYQTLSILGFDYMGYQPSEKKKGNVIIPCSRDMLIYQTYNIQSLLSDEIISKIQKLRHRPYFYSHSQKTIDMVHFYLSNFIMDNFRSKGFTKNKNRESFVGVVENKRIDFLINKLLKSA